MYVLDCWHCMMHDYMYVVRLWLQGVREILKSHMREYGEHLHSDNEVALIIDGKVRNAPPPPPRQYMTSSHQYLSSTR